MKIVIRGDKIKITDAMRAFIEEKLKKLDKYLEDRENATAKVVAKVHRGQQRVEVTIPLKTFILRAEESRDDFYAAVDKTVDKLERQIRKNKTKLQSKKSSIGKLFDLDEIMEEDNDKDIIKRKKVDAKPMDEDEAIVQMELLDHDFYLYKDVDTKNYAVIYKRKDGGYGKLEA